MVNVRTENASVLPKATIEAIMASPFTVVVGSGDLATSSETTISRVIEAETPDAAGFQAVTSLPELGIVRLDGVKVLGEVTSVRTIEGESSE
jgi:hypothetical protein